MSLSLVLLAVWAILATVTALLPLRYQYLPGSLLLLAAPALIAFVAVQHGLWVATLGVFAFFLLFRRPLLYLGRKALGGPTQRPVDSDRSET